MTAIQLRPDEIDKMQRAQDLLAALRVMSSRELNEATSKRLATEFSVSGYYAGAAIRDEQRRRP